MQVCFICTFVTIVGAVAVVATKELLNIRRQHLADQEEIIDDIGVDHSYHGFRGYYDEDDDDDEDEDEEEPPEDGAEEETDSKE